MTRCSGCVWLPPEVEVGDPHVFVGQSVQLTDGSGRGLGEATILEAERGDIGVGFVFSVPEESLAVKAAVERVAARIVFDAVSPA